MTPSETTTAAPDRGNGGLRSTGRLSRNVIALGFVSLLTDVASEMTYTQVPLFLTGVLLAPAKVVGLIEGVAESVASLLKLVSGRLSDRSGRRKPLTVAGYGLGAVSKPLLSLATVWPTVLLLRFLDRVGKGLRTAPRDALIAEATPPALRGRAFGLHRAMDTTGAVLGPLLGYWFLQNLSSDIRHLFLFAALPGLLAVLTLLFFVRERKPVKDAPPPSEGERRSADKAEPPSAKPAGGFNLHWQSLDPVYRRFLLVVFLFNLGNFSDTFLILRAQSVGFTPKEILLLYALFNVVEAVFGYGAGALSDRVGRRPLILTGYCIFALVYLGFAFVTSRAAVCLLFVFYGGYYTLTQGVQRAFAADLSDPAQRATQIGAYHTIVGLALLPASLLAGVLYDRNPALPFVLGACLAAASALLLLFQRTPVSGR